MPWRWRLLCAYVRRELPAWGPLYRALGGYDPDRWRDAGFATVRGKLHGYAMELDLGNWSERLTWFLARYHDLLLQRAMRCVLRPGDCFVDVGANLGMLTLLGRFLVGDSGRVIACEPNPRMVARLRGTLATNGLADVQVQNEALSDRDGRAELREFDAHAGWGTLAAAGPDGARQTAAWTVRCLRGDALLASLPDRPMVIKIDVEGHEVKVLRGLEQTLAQRHPLVFVEVVDRHQRADGSSSAELRAELERHGYRGWVLEGRRRFVFRHDVVLRPLAAGETRDVDVLFVPPSGPLAERVAPLLP